jgi:hypothetical protein
MAHMWFQGLRAGHGCCQKAVLLKSAPGLREVQRLAEWKPKPPAH